MQSTRAMVVAVGVVVSLMAAGQARATIISGTFSGIAENSWLNNLTGLNPISGDFNGSPAIGTFSLDLSSALTPEIGPSGPYVTNGTSSLGYLYFPIHPLAVLLTFNAAGMSAALGSDGSTLVLSDGPAGQSIFLEADSFDPYHYAILDLAGPAGSFFSNLDIATFHPGLVDLANSSASFFDSRDFGARPTILTNFQSPGFTVAAVSEPPSWLILASGLGILALLGAARSRPSRRGSACSTWVRINSAGAAIRSRPRARR